MPGVRSPHPFPDIIKDIPFPVTARNTNTSDADKENSF
ncbi:hypothetical protein ASAP_2067 [Asaia bogorensis]|uniref:Uncharacterized protein n=1 Tax=Asaia bogorensis TaxID=91915 RepID=A0A060QL90_9PROT|nr:hypothetical protein ASAP_2067 [Asaia bogorensis]